MFLKLAKECPLRVPARFCVRMFRQSASKDDVFIYTVLRVDVLRDTANQGMAFIIAFFLVGVFAHAAVIHDLGHFCNVVTRGVMPVLLLTADQNLLFFGRVKAGLAVLMAKSLHLSAGKDAICIASLDVFMRNGFSLRTDQALPRLFTFFRMGMRLLFFFTADEGNFFGITICAMRVLLAFLQVAAQHLFLLIALFRMPVSFAFFKTANKLRFLCITRIRMRMLRDLRQSADQIPV